MTPVLWLWILGSAVEVVVLDVVLTLRDGIHARIDVPLTAVAGTRRVEHELPGLLRSIHVEPVEGEGDRLLVGVSSRTNLELVLAGPTSLRTPSGHVVVTRVGLGVGEPRNVAELLRRPRPAPAR